MDFFSIRCKGDSIPRTHALRFKEFLKIRGSKKEGGGRFDLPRRHVPQTINKREGGVAHAQCSGGAFINKCVEAE